MIYVLGYHGKSLISKMITKWTFAGAGGTSHVSLVNGATLMEIEAWHKGGVLPEHPVGSLHTPGTPATIYRIHASTQRQYAIWRKAHEYVGKGYDFVGIMGLLRRRDRQNPDKVFCSELVDECEKAAGLKTLNLPSHKITPMLTCAMPIHIEVGKWITGQPWPEL
jgi:hypothetical protein